MGPELALAVEGTVVETTALIIKLYRKIQEVRQFKGKCQKLLAEASTLKIMLEQRREAVDSLTTLAKLTSCFQRIEEFIDRCSSYNVVETSWEVFFTRAYQGLCKDLSFLKNLFIFESIPEILKREQVKYDAILDVSNVLTTAHREEMTILESIQRTTIHGTLDHDFSDDFDIQFSAGDESVGYTRIDGVGQVACYVLPQVLVESTSRNEYMKIQDGALVQRLFGTVKRGKSTYAVMEDLRHEPTLAQACADQSLPSGMKERMQLAYDVAKSMAWYHRAEMLIKSVSDHTVVLRELPSGRMTSVLTRLETARHFLEETTNTKYDVRYEAPEFEATKRHSRYTDVWTLGVVIWQCVTSQVPWKLADPVTASSPATPEFLSIRSELDSGALPDHGQSSSLSPQLEAVLRKCWHHNPLLRATASEIAQSLQDLTILLSLDTNDPANDSRLLTTQSQMVDAEHDNDIITEAMERIREARKLNEKQKNLIRLPHRMTRDRLQQLLKGDEWGSSKYFVVGALIFWDLADLSPEDRDALCAGGETGLFSVLNSDEQRATTTLQFLESAAAQGYKEAWLEMYKAHGLLARRFLERS